MIGQSNHGDQTECRVNAADRDTSLNNTVDPHPVIDMYTREKNIVSKVRSEVDSVTTTVEITV